MRTCRSAQAELLLVKEKLGQLEARKDAARLSRFSL